MMIRTETKQKQELKEAVREHYESVSLSTSQIEALENMYAKILEEELEQAEPDGIPPHLVQPHSLEERLQKLKEIQAALASQEATSPEGKIAAIQDGLSRKALPSSSFTYTFSGVRELSLKKVPRLLSFIGIFSVLAVALGGFLWWSGLFPNEPQGKLTASSLHQSIVAESAIRHSENKSLSLRSSSMKQIRKHFSSINFNPIQPKRFRSKGWFLLGAKLSSIQGRESLNLRYRSIKDGRIYSLYQLSPWEATSFLKKEKRTTYLGHKVSAWIEKGLLFVFVSPQKYPPVRE